MASLATATALVVGWFFNIPLTDFYLWLGSFLIYYSFFFIYIIRLPVKLFIIFGAIVLISLFAFFVLSWPLMVSLMVGVAMVALMLFVYLIL